MEGGTPSKKVFEGQSEVFRDISVADVAAIVTGSKTEIFNIKIKNFIVLDARYEYEYKDGHVRGMQNLLCSRVRRNDSYFLENSKNFVIFHKKQ